MISFTPVFCILAYCVAFMSGFLIMKVRKIPQPQGRFETIDGIRGLLAIGVVICHFVVWYQFIIAGVWHVPDSFLYLQLGKANVAFFFMVTSFLFTEKFLNSKNRSFGLKDFYLSRVFRIVPLYYFVTLIVIVFVLVNNNWKLNVRPRTFINEIVSSLFFNRVVIDKDDKTLLVDAGVTWTLLFEWFFYFTLPVIFLCAKKVKKSDKIYSIAGILFFLLFVFLNVDVVSRYDLNVYFLAGAIPAIVSRYSNVMKKVDSKFVAWIIILLIFLLYNFKYNEWITIGIMVIIFAAIAMGNSLFNFLRHPVAKMLGEISYSIYLVHGVILFTFFFYIIRLDNLKQMTKMAYILVSLAMIPIVITVSSLTFIYIEKPLMDMPKKIKRK